MRRTAAVVAAGLAIATVLTLPEVPLPPVKDPRAEPVLIWTPSPDEAVRLADAQLLAELALAEDPRAIEAVAWVVLNRADRSGQGILEIVTARRQFGTLRGGVFHPSWPKPWKWFSARYEERLGPAIDLAAAVLDGQVPDPTGGATHFHRAGTWVPPWAPHPAEWVRVGSHHFYQEL